MRTKFKPNEIWDVIVIGGGPAGMFAAGTAGKNGAKVLLLEKNETLGKKLLLTGGGRCNLTNAEFDNRKFLDKFEAGGKFLFSTFSEWNAKNTLDFFESMGVKTKIENEGRVFPESNLSSSILSALFHFLKQSKVTVKYNCPVREIKHQDSQVQSVTLRHGEEFFAKHFIIATGGKSYPETGSTGDAFKWLSGMGHNIIETNSALVPINIKDNEEYGWFKNVQGLALPDIKISLVQENKKILSKKGKILFTHFGVSGPAILNMSKKIGELLSYGEVFISLDLFPDHDFSTLNLKLQEIFKTHSNKKFKNVLPEIVPASMASTITELSGIDEETPVHSITKEERIRLMHLLKDLQLKVKSLQSPENAIVSSGGVDLKEINFKTMQSKLFNNLYLTGDILNINRPSGGYSLQLCWSTGFVAGNSASLSSAPSTK